MWLVWCGAPVDVGCFCRRDRCVHRNSCLRITATFAGRAKSPAHTEFAARAAIASAAIAVVMVNGGGCSR